MRGKVCGWGLMLCRGRRQLHSMPAGPLMIQPDSAADAKCSAGQCATAEAGHVLTTSVRSMSCLADCAQVKKAYRQLVLRFHPDKALGRCRFSSALHATCRPALTHSQVTTHVSRRLWTPLTAGALAVDLASDSSKVHGLLLCCKCTDGQPLCHT